MPETMIPVSSPLSASLLNSIPTTRGVKMTKKPGAIILLSEAYDEIATHLSG